MSAPFAAMFDALFADPAFAETVDYDYNDQTIAPSIPALVRIPTTEGDLGEVRIQQDAREFEIRVSDLLIPPARGHKIVSCQRTYEVQSPPHKDQLGIVWIIDAYLI